MKAQRNIKAVRVQNPLEVSGIQLKIGDELIVDVDPVDIQVNDVVVAVFTETGFRYCGHAIKAALKVGRGDRKQQIKAVDSNNAANAATEKE